MTATMHDIRTPEPEAAQMWDLGGGAYDEISFAVSDALAHAAQRLNARPGQEILDVATGTGWTARNVARTGARVTAVDFAPDLLAAGRDLSAHVRPPITFRQADAEDLPFPDAGFDGVISTFGVMFAADSRRAADELARVCRPGGRLVLATWTPDGAVREFFELIGKHGSAPPPQPSPLDWGDPDHVRALLGDAFDLTFEPGVNHAYYDSADDVWDGYARGFGPVKQLADSLNPDRRRAFRQDFDAYHNRYATDAGLLHIRREYLVTVGTRR